MGISSYFNFLHNFHCIININQAPKDSLKLVKNICAKVSNNIKVVRLFCLKLKISEITSPNWIELLRKAL